MLVQHQYCVKSTQISEDLRVPRSTVGTTTKVISSSRYIFRNIALALIGTTALICPKELLASDISITNGSSVTTTQTLTDVGDTGTVESGGDLSVADGNAMVISNSDQTVSNSGYISVNNNSGLNKAAIYSHAIDSFIYNYGTIETFNDYAMGILSTADNPIIKNAGSIDTAGTYSHGAEVSGDNANLINAGSIDTTGYGAIGLFISGSDATLINDGSIDTSGTYSHGAEVSGDNANFKNTGSIGTTGYGGVGLLISGSDATIVNYGSIDTSGTYSHGVDVTGDDSSFKNTGSINTTGDGGIGLLESGDRADILNDGKITTAGVYAYGIYSTGTDSSVKNLNSIITSGDYSSAILSSGGNGGIFNNGGTIRTTGASAFGVSITGNDNEITNSGTIVTTGSASGGIYTNGTGNTVTNSGTISVTSGAAISMTGADSTLNLLRSPVINGDIIFSDPGTATLNFDLDRSGTFTVTGVPSTIETNDMVASINGSQVTVYAPQEANSFNTSGTVVNNLTGAITDNIQLRLRPGIHDWSSNRPTMVSSYADTGSRGSIPFPGIGDNKATPDTTVVWGSGLGQYLNRSGSNGFTYGSGGLIAGAERELANGDKAGVFVGLSKGYLDGGYLNAATTGYFGGAYWGKQFGENIMDATLTAGYLTSKETTQILDNSSPTGYRNLHSGTGTIFVSPSLAFSRNYRVTNGTLTPTIRTRYSGLFQTNQSGDSLVEVNTRNLHLGEVRGQLSYGLDPVATANGVLVTSFGGGMDGIVTIGDVNDAVLRGTQIAVTATNEAVARGFLQSEIGFLAANGWQFGAALEGAYDTQDTLSGTGRLDVKARF